MLLAIALFLIVLKFLFFSFSDLIEWLVSRLEFSSPDSSGLSVTGCKQVDDLVVTKVRPTPIPDYPITRLALLCVCPIVQFFTPVCVCVCVSC